MKRKVTIISATTVLVAGLGVAGWMLLTPAPIDAICFCSGQNNATPQNWGKGTSCAAAEDDLFDETWPDAVADCGGPAKVCEPELVVQACYPIGGGMYNADGYLLYGCRDQCGPPIP